MQKDKISSDGYTYSIILNGMRLNNSSKDLVLKTLENIEKVLQFNNFKQDETLFNSILEICAKYNLLEELKKFYLIMNSRNIRNNPITCEILIRAFGDTNQYDEAYVVFEKMINSNMIISNSVYKYVLDICEKAKINMSSKIYDSLQKNSHNLNSIIFTTIIKGLINAEALQEAKNFFSEVKIHKNLPGMIITYNCALDVLARTGDIDEALSLFKFINDTYTADLISYSTIIKALCLANRKQSALDYVKKMIHSKISVDISVINLFLESCANKNEFRYAIKCYQYSMMQNVKPNEITFGIMIKIFGFSRELYKAFDLLDLISVYNIVPSIIIFTNLVHISFYNRNPRKAELAVTLFKRTGRRGDCLLYSKIIDGLIRFRQVNKIHKYINYALKDKCRLKSDTIKNILKHFNNPEMNDKLEKIKKFSKFQKIVNVFPKPNKLISNGVEKNSLFMDLQGGSRPQAKRGMIKMSKDRTYNKRGSNFKSYGSKKPMTLFNFRNKKPE